MYFEKKDNCKIANKRETGYPKIEKMRR